MHRRGHIGVAMFAYAPVGYLLLQDNRVGLALLGLLGVLMVEPLPDNDFRIPGLRHRGASHSLLCALLVGGVIGALGWVVGEHLSLSLAAALAGLDTSTVGIFAGILGWTAEQLRRFDGQTLAVFGFAVGAFGILVHLLADAITIGGIRPLLPLSRRRISLSSIHAESPVANNALFGLGVLTLAVVLFVTAPGVGFAAAPADISPVGVASGQSANQSQNATNAVVTFQNQTTNGTTVTISSVTLPEGGFVTIHGPGYAQQGIVSGSAITASRYLEPGTHRNVTISFANGVPGAVSNTSEFSGAYAPLSAVVYADTNGNRQFDYVKTLGQNDTAYRRNGSRVDDQARIVTQDQLNRTRQPSASVTFMNQSVSGRMLTVERVSLPEGGFVVVHNERYLPPTRDPLNSAVGLSRYLEPGTHRNVTVFLFAGSINRSQTLIAVPYRDTNGNQSYDYVRSGGVADYAYVNRSADNATIVTDTARVSVTPSTPTATRTPAPTPADTSAAPATQPSPTIDRSPTGDAASDGVLVDVPMWLEVGLLLLFAFIGVQLIARWT